MPQTTPPQRGKEKAAKAASAALDAVVPGAGRAVSMVWKYRKQIGGLVVSMILLLATCAGAGVKSNAPIDEVEAVTEIAIATTLITEAKNAAKLTGSLEDGGVPWTVIAGIALAATNAGRYSPWDQCDRHPEGPEGTSRAGYSQDACSEEPSSEDEIIPHIGNDSDPALGPYLLKRGVIPKDGDEFEIDPHRIKLSIKSLDDDPATATDFVVQRLAALRAELQDEGYSFSADDPDKTAASWAEAVRRVGVLDPNSASGCLTPFFPPNSNPAAARKEASRVIDTTWRCILSQAPLHTFSTSSMTSDPAELTPWNAVSQAVQEALTVSWVFSQWGTAQPGCSVDAAGLAVVTAADGDPAGFFPLTQPVFEEFSTNPDANRCDKAANVEAAARAFAAGETIEPGKQRDDGKIGNRTDEDGPWNKAIGGWEAMPWALGTEIERLRKVGPLSVETAKFEPSQECISEIGTWLETASLVMLTTYRPDQGEPLSQADAQLVADHAWQNPLPGSCAFEENAAFVFNQFVAAQAQNLGTTLWSAWAATTTTTTTLTPTTTVPEPSSVLLEPFTADQQRASAYLSIAQWFSARQGTSTAATPPSPIGGVNSIVPRLSLTGAALSTCTEVALASCLPEIPRPAPDAYARRVLEIARAAGGVVEGEDVSGRDLFELLSTPQIGALSNTACMPSSVGKAIDVALQKYQAVMLQSAQDPKVKERMARSVIPVDLILEQYATESSFGVGYVDELGWTGVRMAAEGQVADTGEERGAYKSPSRTKGVIGPRIGDSGYADTDAGRIDGIVDEDRAVGVLQFLPSSWMGYQRLFPGLLLDADGDGVADPHNAYDQTLAMVLYYARNAQGRDLSTDVTAREQGIAQYGGFTLGSEGFRNYMQRREQKVRPVLACLQAEGAVAAIPGVTLAADGCPTAVPQNTLRGGSIGVDVHALCLKSVNEAPTPQAKQALKFLFANIGAAYSATERQRPGKFDCSSYVMTAYRSAGIETFINGIAPNSYMLGPAVGYSSMPWLRDVPKSKVLPGDILVRIPPDGHHVMVLLSDGWIIHTGGPEGDPAHITKLPKDFSTLKLRRVVPELAPALR